MCPGNNGCTKPRKSLRWTKGRRGAGLSVGWRTAVKQTKLQPQFVAIAWEDAGEEGTPVTVQAVLCRATVGRSDSSTPPLEAGASSGKPAISVRAAGSEQSRSELDPRRSGFLGFPDGKPAHPGRSRRLPSDKPGTEWPLEGARGSRFEKAARCAVIRLRSERPPDEVAASNPQLPLAKGLLPQRSGMGMR